MRLLVRCGNRAEALRQYQVCEALLREELGVAPDEETRKLHLSIKDGEAAPAPAAAAAAPDPRLALTDPKGAGDRPMVAVLPFANPSDDENSRWLSEGLVDDVIFTLSAFRAVVAEQHAARRCQRAARGRGRRRCGRGHGTHSRQSARHHPRYDDRAGAVHSARAPRAPGRGPGTRRLAGSLLTSVSARHPCGQPAVVAETRACSRTADASSLAKEHRSLTEHDLEQNLHA